jgi:oligopeptide/dipeptide ABC transporter ATP-binding protein
MRKMRGKRIAMIFQEPMTALNPVLKVGSQIVEQLCAHKIGQDKAERWDRAVELLSTVGIPSPGNRVKQYPHQLSGGMRQRVMIAMALSCNPDLLIADEPTTALDVTIQAQILELLRELQDKFGMAIQFITHDMGVISEISDRIIVMYAGIIVESGPAEEIFANPRHPYTVGLLNSIPRIGGTQNRLNTIEGTVPNLANLPKGCPFQNRCSRVKDICKNTEVKLELIAGKQSVACFNPVPA